MDKDKEKDPAVPVKVTAMIYICGGETSLGNHTKLQTLFGQTGG